jgi:hypothetical protein
MQLPLFAMPLRNSTTHTPSLAVAVYPNSVPKDAVDQAIASTVAEWAHCPELVIKLCDDDQAKADAAEALPP